MQTWQLHNDKTFSNKDVYIYIYVLNVYIYIYIYLFTYSKPVWIYMYRERERDVCMHVRMWTILDAHVSSFKV